MKTVHVLLGAELLQATDDAAKRTRTTRSALIRNALREFLANRQMLALETRS